MCSAARMAQSRESVRRRHWERVQPVSPPKGGPGPRGIGTAPSAQGGSEANACSLTHQGRTRPGAQDSVQQTAWKQRCTMAG